MPRTNHGTALSTSSRFLNWFLESIDLSENILNAKDALRGIPNGADSWAYFFGACFIALVTGLGAWHFDLYSSWTAMDSLRDQVAVSLGATWLAAYGPKVLSMFTYAPTVFELFGSRFARFNNRWLQLTTYGLCLFDLWTDRAAVYAFVGPQWEWFAKGGIPGMIAWYIWFAVMWALATYGFEVIFFTMMFCVIVLFFKGLAGNKKGRRDRPSYREEDIIDAETIA